MSIANEISRLQTAKQEIKNSLQQHGVIISEEALLNEYATAIDGAPYAVTGFFTPEEDTQVFSVEGLPFELETVYVSLTEDIVVNGMVTVLGKTKDCFGIASGFTIDSGALITTRLVLESRLIQFTEKGCVFNCGLSSGYIGQTCFKAGYTYKYFLVGNYNSNALQGGNNQ